MSSRRLLLALPLALLACSQSSPSKQEPPPSTGPSTTPPDTALVPVQISLPASPADPPRSGKPPPSVGSGNGLTILAMHGLFRLDPPLPGEPLIEGLVQVELNGSTPPADLTVSLNGVALVRRQAGGALHSLWAVDPAGPQPVPDAAGYITVTAKTGGLTRSLPIPCPADIGVGATYSSAGSLDLVWSPNLLVNDENPFPSDYYASAHVRSLDATTFTAGQMELAQKLLPKETQRVSLDLSGANAAAYLAELRWQGHFVSDGDSRAFCGRAKRLAYAR